MCVLVSEQGLLGYQYTRIKNYINLDKITQKYFEKYSHTNLRNILRY
jgi:hypothetical protein